MRQISAANANRRFSKLLRDVKAGEPVTITARGLPVAVLAPVSGQATVEAEQARARLLGRLKRQKPKGLGWNRDALYDEPTRSASRSTPTFLPMPRASTTPNAKPKRLPS